MIIEIKNNDTLIIDEFTFKCCVGKKGTKKDKLEGDGSTPKGIFKIGKLFWRSDRNPKPETKLNCLKIKKNMRWCNDVKSKYYNKLFKNRQNIRSEKMFRKDYKYDYLISINYNTKKIIKNLGSAIFLHLTKNYKSTAGCIAVKKKDFLIICKLLNKKDKIKIF